MAVNLKNPEHNSTDLMSAIKSILDRNLLCAISTINEDTTPHINTAYFCFDDCLNMYFLSDAETTHSHNILSRPTVSLAIYDSEQGWDDYHKGLQVSGICKPVEHADRMNAESLYTCRFPTSLDYANALSDHDRASFFSRFYKIVPFFIKVLEEETFGEEVFLNVEVSS